jgi:outer membrane protein
MADSIDIMDANTLLVSAQRRISDAQYIHYFSVLKILYTKGELTQFLLSQTD